MKMLTVTVVLSLLAGVAAAGTVEYWVQGDGSNFYVIVSVSPSDNAGLAIYEFDLTETIDSTLNKAPKNDEDVGFILFRSAKNATPLAAGQDVVPASTTSQLLYGVGQKVNDYSSYGGSVWKGHPNPPSEVGITLGEDGWIKPAGASYTYAIVLHTGTYSGASPEIDDNATIAWSLFDNTTSGDTSDPTTKTNLGFVPEPATIALIVMGALALLRRKR